MTPSAEYCKAWWLFWLKPVCVFTFYPLAEANGNQEQAVNVLATHQKIKKQMNMAVGFSQRILKHAQKRLYPK
jgi:hypothetical protein